MSKKNRRSGSLTPQRHTSSAPAMLEALEPRLLLSLVAHLELNETSGTTAADTVSDHDGTLSGDTTWTGGRIDNGTYFDGSGDSISLDNSNDFDFGASTSFTVSAWVRDDGSGNYAPAVSRGVTTTVAYGSTAQGAGWAMSHYLEQNQFVFAICDGSTNVRSGFYAPSAPDGAYHLFTMVVDRSTAEMRSYIDGVLFDTADISSIGSIDSTDEDMQIGGSGTWKGMVDDVRVYDNALSTTDVENLYKDAPTWAMITANDGIAVEDTGDTAVFRIARTGTLSGAITVNYSVSGTAASGDYSETLGGTATIADGESYVDVTITPVDDAADNGETIMLTLASGTGYTVSMTDSATVTIYDEAGKLAYLPMDETSGTTTADATGNGFDGTLYDNATWTNGQIDNGVDLDGLHDYVALDNSDKLDFGASQSFTVSVWALDDGVRTYVSAISAGNSKIHYGNNDLGAGWAIGNTLSNRFYFGVGDGMTAKYGGTTAYSSGFHMLTMVVNRDTQMLYGYVDGVLKVSRDISTVGSLSTYTESIEMGTSKTGWDGVIDDVRIYNYALDSAGVEYIYEHSFPEVSIIAPDALAYESSGDTATFRIYRAGTNGDIAVDYSVSGTASSGDYSETLSGTATIADGNTYVDITITPVSDAADDGETLTLTLAEGTGYLVGDNDDATITIYDVDPLLMRLNLDETSGTTADDSMCNHDGTLSGDTTWDDGRINNGAYFDGSGDSISVANSDDFDFGASTSFTVSAWVRDDGSSQYAPAVSRGATVTIAQGGTAQGAGWALSHYTKGQNQFVFGISDGTQTVRSSIYAVTAPDDVFHLLTMVVDRSTAEMRSYVDGVLFSTADISSIGSIDSTGEALQLGGSGGWKGMIDDVRVYAQVLSTSDVEALYEDAPTWVTVYADDGVAVENTGDTATFHVLRSGDLEGDITVNYSVSGTASGSDYSETLGGTVTIADGESYVDVTITPVADAGDNGETVTLTLAAGTGYAVSDVDEATAVIYDSAGLLARLMLDETSGSTAADATGNGFTGTLSGDAAWTDGQINNAVSLDGPGDYITLANADKLDFGGSQSFTVSLWALDEGSGFLSIINTGNSKIHYGNMELGGGWSIGSSGLNEFSFGVGDDMTAVYDGTGSSCGSGFHLLTMVVDRDAQMLYGYVDGELEVSEDISSVGSLATFSAPVTIASNAGWYGLVDDVRIYDYALDATAVENLYESNLPEVSIAVINATAVEDTADTATFRISRSNTGGNLVVDYSVSGTASSADYSETLSGTVTITDGNSYVDITITPVDDATSDDGETLTLTLASDTSYELGNTVATAVIYDTDHLLAHLELDETSGTTADDAAGNHDGTLSGDTAWDDGRIDNGATFGDVGDTITLANSDDFDFGASTSFTVSAWILDESDDQWAVAVSRGNDQPYWNTANGPGWSIGHYEYTPGKFWFRVTDGSAKVNYYTSQIYDPTMFHLTTMVIDRSAAMMYCYVDGELDGSVSIASIGSISSSGEALQIGTSNSYHWQGMIDDVRVYDRTLSSDDVATLYTDDAPTWALVAATDSTAIEDTGDTATFRIYRQGSTDGTMTVNYSVSGTAASGDYSETLGGTVTIADGESYTDITITPVSDGSDNGETLTLTLTTGTGYTPGNLDSATATIYDTGQLLMHLKLDETSGSTAADDTGNGHTGTRYGDTVWDDGRINNGAYFDHNTDRIDVANSTDFDFGASQSFTVSAWVRDDGSGNYVAAVSRGSVTGQGMGYGTTQGPGWIIGQYSTALNEFVFGISDGIHSTHSTEYTPSEADGYHLLTMVVDRSAQQMLCYADGVLFSTDNISSIGNISSSANSLLQLGGSGLWEGIIDDVRVYNYALSGTDVGDLYENAPTWITIHADDAMASEDAVGTDSATFRVLRTGSLSGAVTVNYSVSGTAASGDYSETLGGTVTIGDGESYADITVTPVDDGTADSGETLTVTLASGAGYAVSEIDSATATIYDEPQLLAHWKMDETSGDTAADATGNGFDATRYGNTGWDYGRVGNGAYFDGSGDYLAVADANGLDFGAGQSFTVSAWVRDDGTTSGPSVIAKGNTKANMGQTGDGAGWAMGRYGSGSFNFGVTDGLTSVTNETISEYPSDGSFHLMTMTVDRGAQILRCFIDGQLVGQEDISSVGSLDSFAESLYIGLGNNYAKGIIDDVRVYSYALSTTEVASLYAAAPPVVGIVAVVSDASETGPVPGTFRVARVGSTTEALEVDYTVTGTATGADYSETLSGTVTIAAGESYADITVTPVDDASNEGDETIIVTLATAVDDYAILDGADSATVTIGDSDNVSDPQVVIGVADGDASEDGSDPGTFRIYRSGATTSDLAVNYTVSGTAESSDYSETLSGTVTITSGNSYVDITITPVEDTNFEYPETLVLTLTEDAGYTIGLSDAATVAITDVPFSELLNPTGDPIGGGENYSDIIDSGDADYVVDTAAELIAALSSATYGDVIYVEDDAEIDLTGYIADTIDNGLVIPAGVTLASGRGNNGSSGGLLYTTDEWSNMNRVGMLVTGGDDVRITGLRLQGPSGYCLDAATDGKYASGIRSGSGSEGAAGNHENLEVDNCEIYNWTMAGVYVMYGEGVSVHHNYIHTNIGEGYQYGVWFGGNASAGAEWVAEAEANLFDCNRHDIGSASQWPWAARYNIFGPNQYLQILDRHAGPSVDTWIENNWNQADSSMEFRCGFTSDGGGTVYYNNNWTTKDELGPSWLYTNWVITVNSWPATYVTAEAADNTFSFDEYDDPYTPVAASSATLMSDGYTVAFDSGDSYDPEGLDIVSHQWWFGDDSSQQGVVSYEDDPTYTYTDPGMYEVIHNAYNEYGVAGYESYDVIVRPTDGGYWLSAWVKDSATGTPSSNSTKQVLVNDNVVWSDDVYGDEGWQHVVVDISSYVTEGTGAKIAFRLVSAGGYYAAMSVDNVYVFGGDVGDPEMNNYRDWTVSEPDNWIVMNKARVGRLATRGTQIMTWGTTAGTGEVSQVVPIGKALVAMATDDFESGDGTGGDNWDANWVLTGSAAVTSGGTPYDGTYHLLLTGSSAVASRAVDLSGTDGFGYDDVTLSFEYKADSFESGEYVTVEIYDGTQWQEVMVIEDGDDDGDYHLASIDLSGYSLTDDFEVRFTASLADAGDFFYVDDLMIA